MLIEDNALITIHYAATIWGTGVRATPALDFQLFNLFIVSDSELHKL